MRRRAWIAIGLAVGGFLFGTIGQSVDAGADLLFTISGALLLAAILVGLSLLPVWAPLRGRVPPLPGLFSAVPAGARWCGRCGSSAPADATCDVCGHAPPSPRDAARPAPRSKSGKSPTPRTQKSKR